MVPANTTGEVFLSTGINTLEPANTTGNTFLSTGIEILAPARETNNMLHEIVLQVSSLAKGTDKGALYKPAPKADYVLCNNCLEHHPPGQMACKENGCGVCGSADHNASDCIELQEYTRCECQYYPRHTADNCPVIYRLCHKDGVTHKVCKCDNSSIEYCGLCGGNSHSAADCKLQRC